LINPAPHDVNAGSARTDQLGVAGGESRFVGIGVGRYESPGLTKLEHAVADVEAVRRLLGDAFVGEPLCNPTEGSARTGLRAVVKSMPDGGSLIMLWSGHGLRSPAGDLMLMCTDSSPSVAYGLDARSVVRPCALSGASQILFIIDTCFSGEAVPDATQVAARLVEAYPPDANHVWVGVLASCPSADTAVDGRFGALLCRLLTPGQGPRDPHVRRRWSEHNAQLRGDDLCDAVLKDWEDKDRMPRFRGDGNPWWMFPNPIYRAGAPRQVVEHLLRAARGGSDERSWFTGRTVEVDTVVGWVREGRPGVFVVTGSAGTGKSAIAGRVVSLSDPVERERLSRAGKTWEHADPEPDSVHAHAHARALTADRLADLLDGQLCGIGFLDRADDPRNAAELLGAVQRAVERGKGTPVLVVDGLDEARGESFTIAHDLLVRLGRWATVIVSTRPVPGEDGTLVQVLRPAVVLDLDEPTFQAAGRSALRAYVESRLAGLDPPIMDPVLVADHVLESSPTADRPFLLARVITDQLRARPVDTSRPGWEGEIATSIETALDLDLGRVVEPPHRELRPGWRRRGSPASCSKGSPGRSARGSRRTNGGWWRPRCAGWRSAPRMSAGCSTSLAGTCCRTVRPASPCTASPTRAWPTTSGRHSRAAPRSCSIRGRGR
jgi:AAA ATPase domain/Caspase domain